MRFSIHGFMQETAHGLGLDNNDLLILRWLVDFSATGKMTHIEDCGVIYYWVSYKTLCDDLPILSMKKDTVYRRLKKMCACAVLVSKTIKKAGTYSYYGFGNNYAKLIHSDINPIGYGLKSEGGTDENPKGVRIKIPNKDSSIKSNSSIKEKHIEQKLLINNFFETIWKAYPNKKGKNKISDTQKRKLYQLGEEVLLKCIERYNTDKPDWQDYQHGSSFFNKGYFDYLDENYATVVNDRYKDVKGLI